MCGDWRAPAGASTLCSRLVAPTQPAIASVEEEVACLHLQHAATVIRGQAS